jgi:23S rRNA pseudouridine2605 synthase
LRVLGLCQKAPQSSSAPGADGKFFMNSIRLNKALARAGVCSRRKADEFIAAGMVSVNGAVIAELGARVRPDQDAVFLNGRPVSLAESSFSYLLLHKPIMVLSTVRDPQGRATVLDLLPPALQGKRLYPVGRLDYFSEGLLLLSDDGSLTHRLTHPAFHLPRIYEVLLRETPRRDQIARMRSGMVLAGGERLAPIRVDSLSPKTLRLTLVQGINRQIRRMCRDLGLTILKLLRTGFGPLALGNLAVGLCRPLSPQEIAALRTCLQQDKGAAPLSHPRG